MSVRVGIKVLQAVAAAANFNSNAVRVGYDRAFDLTVIHTLAASGTLSVATSDLDQAGPFTIDTVATALLTQPNGANPGTQKINCENMRGLWWRLQWVGAGAGTITANAVQGDLLAC